MYLKNSPCRDCSNFLHTFQKCADLEKQNCLFGVRPAELEKPTSIFHENMHAIFFTKHGKFEKHRIETVCRITIQLPLFQLKLKHFHFFNAAITLFSRVSFSSTQVFDLCASVQICRILADLCRFVQICRIFADLCRYVQIRKKTDVLRNTIKTPQRCQTNIKSV